MPQGHGNINKEIIEPYLLFVHLQCGSDVDDYGPVFHCSTPSTPCTCLATAGSIYKHSHTHVWKPGQFVPRISEWVMQGINFSSALCFFLPPDWPARSSKVLCVLPCILTDMPYISAQGMPVAHQLGETFKMEEAEGRKCRVETGFGGMVLEFWHLGHWELKTEGKR